MSRLGDILSYNEQFVQNKQYENFHTSKFPDKKIVVLSCMDTRLTELLPHALNIKNGDAKLIKNAGAIVSHPFGSVMRSILVSVYELKADEVFIVGHHDCGMKGLNSHSFLEKVTEKGVSSEVIDVLRNSGVNLDKWLTGFDTVEESVEQSVNRVKHHPLMPKEVKVHGLVIHPETGKLDVVVADS